VGSLIRRTLRRIVGVACTGSAMRPWHARPTGAAPEWWRSEELVGCKHAVPIFIKALQHLGRVGDLIRIDDAIVVRVQGSEQCYGWRSVAAWTARPARPPLFAFRSAAGSPWLVLSHQKRGYPQSPCCDQQFGYGFHASPFISSLLLFRVLLRRSTAFGAAI
jgi:hypothetical protein